jgi:hypothetical protein
MASPLLTTLHNFWDKFIEKTQKKRYKRSSTMSIDVPLLQNEMVCSYCSSVIHGYSLVISLSPEHWRTRKNAMAYPAPNVEEGSIVVEVVSLEGEKIALKVQRFRRCGELG